MGAIREFFQKLRSRLHRPKIEEGQVFKIEEGQVLSDFIARDVRREIEVISTERIAEGIITGRVRTTNILYVSKGLAPEPEFEPPRELRIDELWHWTGKTWGGLPDGTSIVDRPREREPS